MTDADRKNKEPDFKNKEFLKSHSQNGIFSSVSSVPGDGSKSPGQRSLARPQPAEPFSRMAVLAVLGRDAAISTGALPSPQSHIA